MATSNTKDRIEKMTSRLAALKREVARADAAAAHRVAGKAKQCAMISFNILKDARPDVLVWIEGQLKRPQDVKAFAEWRQSNEAPAATPAMDPMLVASSADEL